MLSALTSKLSPTIGHHYVPPQYLRGFEVSDEPGAIWTYDKTSRQFAKIPIKVIAQKADYYNADVERELNESVKRPTHATRVQVRRREQFSPEDRFRLAVYITTMTRRVPRRRRKALEMLSSVLESSLEKVREKVSAWVARSNADEKLIAQRLAEIDRVQEKFSQESF